MEWRIRRRMRLAIASIESTRCELRDRAGPPTRDGQARPRSTGHRSRCHENCLASGFPAAAAAGTCKQPHCTPQRSAAAGNTLIRYVDPGAAATSRVRDASPRAATRKMCAAACGSSNNQHVCHDQTGAAQTNCPSEPRGLAECSLIAWHTEQPGAGPSSVPAGTARYVHSDTEHTQPERDDVPTRPGRDGRGPTSHFLAREISPDIRAVWTQGGGTAVFTDIREARSSPLAKSLFQIQGVSTVFYGADYISVTVASPEWCESNRTVGAGW